MITAHFFLATPRPRLRRLNRHLFQHPDRCRQVSAISYRIQRHHRNEIKRSEHCIRVAAEEEITVPVVQGVSIGPRSGVLNSQPDRVIIG